jgi:16S rRNA (cytosine1402-N4)-methyltransferase
MDTTTHEPVLLEEVLEELAVRPGGHYIDATLGGGGHSEAILERSAPDGTVLGLDQDPDALERTRKRLQSYGDRFDVRRGNFEDILPLVRSVDGPAPDGILMDLGISSDHLDRAERGFSFRFEGPLDMRMDPESGLSAADWLAGVEEDELVRVLRTWGEERQARRIARAVLEAQHEDRLHTTLELAEVVERAVGGRRGAARHPATRTFQAIRMAVNREMDVLEKGLKGSLSLLPAGGRLAVITFHSLEDRMVKQAFRRHEGKEESLFQGGSEWRGEHPRVIRITRKPRVASPEEQHRNPRSRSAKLRVIEIKEVA